MLARWTHGILRWRLLVLALWLGAALAGLVGYHQLGSRLTTSLAVPGSPSSRADAILLAHFGENIEGAVTVVVTHLGSPRADHVAEARLHRAIHAVGSLHVVEQRAVAGLLLTDLESRDTLNEASGAVAHLRAALRTAGLPGALVTGPAALQADVTPILRRDLQRGEIVALALALLLLLGVLGLSVAVIIPFIVAGATTAVALGLVDLLAGRILMVLYVPNVVALVGLGLAIDYSLLIVHRYRAELATHDEPTALARTMATAGRTVVLSGIIVAIGLATMLVVPVPLVRSLGAAGLVVPVVALAAALTLQPALLATLGRRGVATRGPRGLLEPRELATSRWARVTRVVVAHPRRVLLATLVGLGLLAAASADLSLTPGSLSAIPPAMASARAIAVVRSSIGPGILTPIEVLIDSGRPHGSTSPAQANARLALETRLLHTPGVEVVAADSIWPFVDRSGRYARILVVSTGELGSPVTQRLVHAVRREVASAHFPRGSTLVVGGAPAQGVDFLAAIYGVVPWLVLAALVLAWLLLARAFRSMLVATLAVALDLVSVAVAYGLLVWVFRFGVGADLIGTYRVDQIEGWVPVFVFAVLFGLSMDYQVFIVARVREAHDRGLAMPDALVEGLSATGAVVTSAAVIMVAALSGFVIGHVAGLQELGAGLALGVLVDATVIRGLLLPSLLTLVGERAWSGPRRRRPSIR